MNTDPESAQQLLLNARRAVQQGNRQAARRWAEKVVALCPALEEPWLILAAVGSPRASVAYLNNALQINPQSESARKGMHWAVDRLRKNVGESPKAVNLSSNLVQDGISHPSEGLQQINPVYVKEKPVGNGSLYSQVSNPQLIESLSNPHRSFLPMLLLALCVTVFWLLWPGNALPVLALLRAKQAIPPVYSAPVNVQKPTYTPTFTQTFTPTNTSTPTSTSTFTPSPTLTLTPTETFTPTLTLLPADTPLPWSTSTPVTYTDPNPEHWIDVNLSQQMLYAYEGDTIVASFLVSTGVPAFPTVTGQYHIYIKFVSTLMAGDGYYLPNVPYTMYFYKGYGIHGTYWHNNFGHPMSHGCVNMYTPDAEWMFYWASVGTLVNIHY
jgi:lipoprotein-anchoring transpeptidase ErfK/SrfK